MNSKGEQQSRTYNSIINSIVGICTSIVTIALNFAVRIFIVKSLGEDINGLHNLFQSLTNVLALMEAGFCTTMVIHLYKPMRENNIEIIRETLSFYKKLYFFISLIFLFLCIIIMMLLGFIVNSDIEINKIRLYFILFVASYGLSYLTYYKTSVLYAQQKNRVRLIATVLCEIVFRTASIICFIFFKSYIIFLILMIVEKIAINYICNLYVNHNNKYLINYKKIKTRPEIKKAVFKSAKPVFIGQVASTIQQSAKSVLVSILIGSIAIVGYFGNYQLVTSVILLLFSHIGGAMTSGFGNLGVDSGKERMYDIYREVTSIMNLLTIVFCAGYLSAVQDFILTIFGSSFLLQKLDVLFITADMGIYLLCIPVITIQNAMGLHSKDIFAMVLQAILGIILGYLFGKFLGILGILLGMLVPLTVFSFFYKGCVICKEAFGISYIKYLRIVLVDLIKLVIIVVVTFLITSKIATSITALDFFIKGILAVIISLSLYIISSLNNTYFKKAIKRIKGIIWRKNKCV